MNYNVLYFLLLFQFCRLRETYVRPSKILTHLQPNCNHYYTLLFLLCPQQHITDHRAENTNNSALSFGASARKSRRTYSSSNFSLPRPPFFFFLTLSFPHSLDFFLLGVKMRNSIGSVLKQKHCDFRNYNPLAHTINCDFVKIIFLRNHLLCIDMH